MIHTTYVEDKKALHARDVVSEEGESGAELEHVAYCTIRVTREEGHTPGRGRGDKCQQLGASRSYSASVCTTGGKCRMARRGSIWKEREGVRVRVTAAVVGNLRSKTRDPDRHEEYSTQCLCDFGARTHSGYRDKGILSGRHQVGPGERQLPEDKLCS
jgi:hypothetical protein